MIPSFYKEHGFHEIYENCFNSLSLNLTEELRMVFVDTYYGISHRPEVNTHKDFVVKPIGHLKDKDDIPKITSLKKEMVPNSFKTQMAVLFGLNNDEGLVYTITQYVPDKNYFKVCDTRMTTIDFVLTAFQLEISFFADNQKLIETIGIGKRMCLAINKAVWRKEINKGAEDILVLSTACSQLRTDKDKISFGKLVKEFVVRDPRLLNPGVNMTQPGIEIPLEW